MNIYQILYWSTFNHVNKSVPDKHLYLDYENNERDGINSTCDFVSGVLFEDVSNDSEVA